MQRAAVTRRSVANEPCAHRSNGGNEDRRGATVEVRGVVGINNRINQQHHSVLKRHATDTRNGGDTRMSLPQQAAAAATHTNTQTHTCCANKAPPKDAAH